MTTKLSSIDHSPKNPFITLFFASIAVFFIFLFFLYSLAHEDFIVEESVHLGEVPQLVGPKNDPTGMTWHGGPRHPPPIPSLPLYYEGKTGTLSYVGRMPSGNVVLQKLPGRDSRGTFLRSQEYEEVFAFGTACGHRQLHRTYTIFSGCGSTIFVASQKGQWYVLVDERVYGPFDLVRAAQAPHTTAQTGGRAIQSFIAQKNDARWSCTSSECRPLNPH